MTDQPTNRVSEKLFNKISENQTTQESELLMSQYRLYVEMMDNVSARRYQANSYFLTVNTILITALAGLVSIVRQPYIKSGWIIIAALAGIVFCITWRRLIQSYRQLNKGKFVIIHLLETRLPARPFDAEWDALNHGDGTVYKPFSHTEMVIPIIFAFLYGILVLLMVIELFSI